MKNKINEFRKSKKLTVPEFANKLGYSLSFTAKVIYSERDSSINFLRKLKEAYPDADMNMFFLNKTVNAEFNNASLVEWNPEEAMSKEFALSALDEMKSFYRRLFYFPEKEPFSNDKDFEGAMRVLNGLKGFIDSKFTE